jgi:L1 cell adhesion molecule like protein
VEETLKWLDTHQEENREEYTSRKKELDDVVHPIMTKMYSNGAQNGMPGGMPGGMPNETYDEPKIEEVD